MITCTRIIEFDAGHRVVGHEGKCAHLHGHRYKVELTAQAQELDGLGRVIDFGVLKERVGEYCDSRFDHGMILWVEDPLLHTIEKIRLESGEHMKFFALPTNPTAENLAKYLLEVSDVLLAGTEVQMLRIRVWETPNCYADAVR